MTSSFPQWSSIRPSDSRSALPPLSQAHRYRRRRQQQDRHQHHLIALGPRVSLHTFLLQLIIARSQIPKQAHIVDHAHFRSSSRSSQIPAQSLLPELQRGISNHGDLGKLGRRCILRRPPLQRRMKRQGRTRGRKE